MATTPVQIPVEEYLRTVYHPDRDYIDGEVLERNVGEKPHSRLQLFFGRFLAQFEDALHCEIFIEQRVQVAHENYRIPDVALVPLADSDPRIVQTPPLLCIEILSSEDRMRKVRERLADYVRMGVKQSWVVDPWRRLTYAVGADGILNPVEEVLTVPGSPISIAVEAIWAELDRLEARTVNP